MKNHLLAIPCVSLAMLLTGCTVEEEYRTYRSYDGFYYPETYYYGTAYPYYYPYYGGGFTFIEVEKGRREHHHEHHQFSSGSVRGREPISAGGSSSTAGSSSGTVRARGPITIKGQ